MTTYMVKIDSRGRVTIPAPVRRALGLLAGGQLLWRQVSDSQFQLLNASNVGPGSGPASSSEEGAVVVQAPVIDLAATDPVDDYGKKLIAKSGSLGADFDLGI